MKRIIKLTASEPWLSHRVNLPNSITLTRIAAIPLLIWILCTPRLSDRTGEREILASFVFILASITDGIDGYLARKRGQITTMGMLLDPLADKLLIAAAFIALVQFNPALVPAWMAVVIIGREFLVSRFRRFYDSSQRTGQVQNAGADHIGGGGDSCSPLARVARVWHLHFPGLLDCLARHLVHGSAVAGFRARLLRCLLVADRPQIGKAAAPGLRPRPAEKKRCPSCLKRRRRISPRARWFTPSTHRQK
jgi:CDP-diacylglycerol--glycerol-3-phosphate 3-phosphatidyltransferase